jgi:uncharacterized membrane protein
LGVATIRQVKRALIFVHRWLGVALCLVFLLWFPSAIGIMYWDFPDVRAADRIAHAAPIDASKIQLSPAQAFATLGIDGEAQSVQLSAFDGRPVYQFDDGAYTVYADTGEERLDVSDAMVHRIAETWTGQPASAARVEQITDVDQWTVQMRIADLSPLWKFSWPNGEQVYITQTTGEVVQYTTTASRLGAYVGAIPHWLYFTPLRKNGPQWSRVVIWSSGIGTIAAIIGVIIGAWMYSPSKRYRYDGAPSSIPYHGQKRWHTVLGLIFGVATITWAFSGMLSMDPFPRRETGGGPLDRGVNPQSIRRALRGEMQLAAFAAKGPREALAQLGNARVKQLDFTSFAGEPMYLATLEGGDTRIIPLQGAPVTAVDPQRIIDVVTRAAGAGMVDTRVLTQYDRYYLDRRRQRPLPVILAQLHDAERTRYYIDPKTARVVGSYNSQAWVNRWLYNGLHSLNFPWLYNYRPLWDIVVITFMVGGTALCVTSLILAWRVLGRKVRGLPL